MCGCRLPTADVGTKDYVINGVGHRLQCVSRAKKLLAPSRQSRAVPDLLVLASLLAAPNPHPLKQRLRGLRPPLH